MITTSNTSNTTHSNSSHSSPLTILNEHLWTRSTMAQLNQVLDQQGWLHLKLPSDAQWMALATQITGCHLFEQQNGMLFDHVHPIEKKEHLSDSNGSAAIPPHTDGPHFSTPPKYLVLFCRTPDKLGLVKTLFADVHELLQCELTEKDQKLLMKPIQFMSKDGQTKVIAPILNFTALNQILFRYSENIILRGHPSPDTHVSSVYNPHLKEICDRISQWFYHEAYSVTLDHGSLVLINNHRFCHGRTQVFDKKRHLERIWLG